MLKSMPIAFFKALSANIDMESYGKVDFFARARHGIKRMAVIFGHFLGTNHEKLPRFITDFLSLDHKLFKS